MVKINAKIIIWGLVSVFLIGMVYAECGLEISNIKAYVDGKKESFGSIDVKPESELEIKVDVENTCSDDSKIDIEDITVEVIIEGIDDGDDLEEESDDFDLDTEKDKTVTIKFDIPLEVEEDDYNLIIYVSGEQANDSNVDYNASDEGGINVEKESHDIRFTTIELGAEKLKCVRTTTLDVDIINLGTKDEDDIVLQIENSDLGINIKDSDAPELEAYSDSDSDTRYSNSYTITVPDDAAAGTYPIKVTAKYSSKTTTKTVSLTIEDCPAAVEEEEEEEVTTVITPPTTTPTTPTAGVIVQPPTTAVTEEKLPTNMVIIAIIAAEVLVILIGGIFAIRWAARRR